MLATTRPSCFSLADLELRCDEMDGRLPRPSPFTAVHYDLELQPDIYQDAPPFHCSGRVSIHVRCDVETTTMTLNADALRVLNRSIAVLDDPGRTGRQPAINDVRLTIYTL